MRFQIDTFTIKIKKEERSILMTAGGFAGRPKYYVIVGKKTRRPTSYEYQKIYKYLREREDDYDKETGEKMRGL